MNENYEDFLGLGDSLKDGEEKVEEVRVGLLGFRREIDGLKSKVEARKGEIEGLVQERKKLMREEQTGRNLLEVDAKLLELEESLQLQTNGYSTRQESLDLDFSESEDESETDDAGQSVPLARLTRRIQQFLYVQKLVQKIGPEHPFLASQEGRSQKIRQILVLDLNNALQQARAIGGNNDRLLKLLLLYKDLGAPAEALKTLKRPSVR